MARTPSTMLALGTVAPAFALPDPSTGKTVSLDDFPSAKGYWIAFICNHCPFVQAIRHEFARVGREYAAKGIAVIAINANDAATHPEDSPDAMKDETRRFGYSFPYLHDASQQVAQAYRAACTPDFFVFDADRKLVYRGQFDGARPGNDVPVTGTDLRAALDALLAGRPVSAEQKPSLGCNIKWREGNEPAY
jgi:thiol-disulfide isomerase/thioredoxin